jgi:hypothetical protein
MAMVGWWLALSARMRIAATKSTAEENDAHLKVLRFQGLGLVKVSEGFNRDYRWVEGRSPGHTAVGESPEGERRRDRLAAQQRERERERESKRESARARERERLST